jgi:hypothetical protein
MHVCSILLTVKSPEVSLLIIYPTENWGLGISVPMRAYTSIRTAQMTPIFESNQLFLLPRLIYS